MLTALVLNTAIKAEFWQFNLNFYWNKTEAKFQLTTAPTKLFWYFSFVSASAHVKQAVLFTASDAA